MPKRSMRTARGLSAASELRETGGKRHGRRLKVKPKTSRAPYVSPEQIARALEIDPNTSAEQVTNDRKRVGMIRYFDPSRVKVR